MEVERKEKELLAEEQRNINEKLKAIEKEQLQYFEKAKRAEVRMWDMYNLLFFANNVHAMGFCDN